MLRQKALTPQRENPVRRYSGPPPSPSSHCHPLCFTPFLLLHSSRERHLSDSSSRSLPLPPFLPIHISVRYLSASTAVSYTLDVHANDSGSARGQWDGYIQAKANTRLYIRTYMIKRCRNLYAYMHVTLINRSTLCFTNDLKEY